VNVLGACTSIYHWRGKTETAREIPIFIKTSASNYGAVEKLIRQTHRYELPEIIALPVSAGLPAYLEWITSSVMPPAQGSPPPSTS
jgi:periplasmic divalent cation tolerance protein